MFNYLVKAKTISERNVFLKFSGLISGVVQRQ